MKTGLLISVLALLGSISASAEYKVDGNFYGISLGMSEEAVRKALIDKGYTIVTETSSISRNGVTRIEEEKWFEIVAEITKTSKVCALLPEKGNPGGSSPFTSVYKCKSPAKEKDLVEVMEISFYHSKRGGKSNVTEKAYFLVFAFDVKHNDAKETAVGIVGKFGKSPGFFKAEDCSDFLVDALKMKKEEKGSCYVAAGFNSKKNAVVEIHGYGKTVDSSLVAGVKLVDTKILAQADQITDENAKETAKKLGF